MLKINVENLEFYLLSTLSCSGKSESGLKYRRLYADLEKGRSFKERGSMILSFLVIAAGICAMMLWRNEQVFKFRMKVLNELHEQNLTMINAGVLDNTLFFSSDKEMEPYAYYVYRPWLDLDELFEKIKVNAHNRAVYYIKQQNSDNKYV